MTIPLAQEGLNGIPSLAVRTALSSAHSEIWLFATHGFEPN